MHILDVQVYPDGSLVTKKTDKELGPIITTRKLINNNRLECTTTIISNQKSSTALFTRRRLTIDELLENVN